MNFLDGSNEFYWNVSGNEWDWTWDSVTATVLPPDGQTLAAQSVVCYSGAAGSKASDCTIAASGSGVDVSSIEPLTVVATFPPTAFEKPANYDALRAGAVPFVTRYMKYLLGANAAVALLGFIALFSGGCDTDAI